MRILDLDLDFFIECSHIPSWREDSEENRLPLAEGTPWEKEDVIKYLEENCGLSQEAPIPGSVVTYHHEVYSIIKDFIEGGEMTPPFSITHIDAHSDFGSGGDMGFPFFLKTFMNLPIEERRECDISDELTGGNFLLFLAGLRWINELHYVLHPKWSHDIQDYFILDGRRIPDKLPSSIQKYKMRLFGIDNDVCGFPPFEVIIAIRDSIPEHEKEPIIQLELIPHNQYQEAYPFDYIFLSKSPGFTPAESDQLIPVIEEYIEEN